jgi:hypothetical protein
MSLLPLYRTVESGAGVGLPAKAATLKIRQN